MLKQINYYRLKLNKGRYLKYPPLFNFIKLQEIKYFLKYYLMFC